MLNWAFLATSRQERAHRMIQIRGSCRGRWPNRCQGARRSAYASCSAPASLVETCDESGRFVGVRAEYFDSNSRAFSISAISRSWVCVSISGNPSDDLRTGMISLMGAWRLLFSAPAPSGELMCSSGDDSSSRSVMSSALAIRSVFLMEGENRPFSSAQSCVTFMFALAASSFWRSPRAFRHMRTCAPMSNSDCDFICKILFLSYAREKYIINPNPLICE